MQLANARSSSDTGSNGAGETMYFKVMSQGWVKKNTKTTFFGQQIGEWSLPGSGWPDIQAFLLFHVFHVFPPLSILFVKFFKTRRSTAWTSDSDSTRPATAILYCFVSQGISRRCKAGRQALIPASLRCSKMFKRIVTLATPSLSELEMRIVIGQANTKALL